RQRQSQVDISSLGAAGRDGVSVAHHGRSAGLFCAPHQGKLYRRRSEDRLAANRRCPAWLGMTNPGELLRSLLHLECQPLKSAGALDLEHYWLTRFDLAECRT